MYAFNSVAHLFSETNYGLEKQFWNFFHLLHWILRNVSAIFVDSDQKVEASIDERYIYFFESTHNFTTPEARFNKPENVRQYFIFEVGSKSIVVEVKRACALFHISFLIDSDEVIRSRRQCRNFALQLTLILTVVLDFSLNCFSTTAIICMSTDQMLR